MSEHKHEDRTEGKSGEGVETADGGAQFLQQVQEFCMSNRFEAEFERFAEEHADIFLNSPAYQQNLDEHPLEFHEVYQKFLRKFERHIEDFIESVCASSCSIPLYIFVMCYSLNCRLDIASPNFTTTVE